MSITAAPMVAVVGAGLATARTDSFNLWGRKKHKTSSSSCFPGSATSVSIDQHQGLIHPVPFKHTSSFNQNVTALCGQFPAVHHGVITSLLESAANDYSRALCLIRQVSESGVHSSKSSGASISLSFRAKRPRDWNASDVLMADDEGHSDDYHKGETGDRNESAVVELHSEPPALGAPCSGDGDSISHGPDMEQQVVPPFQQPTLDQFHDPLPSASSSSSQTATPTGSPSTPDAYDDAVMNGASLHPSSPAALPSSATSSSDAKSVPCPNSPHTLPGLRHTIQVLSRVVLKQSDKILSLQHEQLRLVEENRHLKSSASRTNEELRQSRETNQILQFYLSSNRATTDFISGNNNGPDGGGNGFDFLGTSRMPDVC